LYTTIRTWLAAFKKRMAAPVLTLEGEAIIYVAGGDEHRVRFDDIQRIDAYPGMADPSHQWAVVYTGSRDKIIVLETTENFVPVFDATLAHLGMNGPDVRINLVSMSPYDGKNQMKRMIYQRQTSGPTVS